MSSITKSAKRCRSRYLDSQVLGELMLRNIDFASLHVSISTLRTPWVLELFSLWNIKVS